MFNDITIFDDRRNMGKQKQKTKSRKKPVVNKPASVTFWKSRTNLLAIIFLIGLVSLCFRECVNFDFVNWDDDRNVYENEVVLNYSLENIKELFTSTVIGNYNPLTNYTFALENKIWGLSPGVFHFNNILLHIICVFLVLRIGLLLGLKLWGAIFLAALFGIHPMRVESVAWITERKDVLYGAFFLGSMFYYIRYYQSKKSKHWIFSFCLFIIGLFAKIQMVALPLSLLAVDYFFGEKNWKKSIASKWLYFLFALLFGVLGIYFLKDQGSLESAEIFTFFDRLFIGSYSFCIYIIKFIFPYKLSPLYPYPPSITWLHYVSMIPFIAFFGLAYFLWKRQFKTLVFGLSFFFVNIVFLLQVLGAGQGYLADRFTYIAYLGLFFIAAYYFDRLIINEKNKSTLIKVSGVAIIAIFSWMTINQVKIWENSETLWTHVLKYYSNSTLPFGNRANHYRDNGQIDLALADYSSVIQLKPSNPKPYNSRAKLHFSRNQDAEALKDYIKAVELDPENPEYIINRGAAYAKLNQLDKALSDLNKGLELEPDNLNGLSNRSLLWQYADRADLAVIDLEKYVSINPNNPNIWHELGRIQGTLKQHQKTIESANKAIQLEPNNSEHYVLRSKANYSLQNFKACANDVKKAQQLGAKIPQGLIDDLKNKSVY